MEIKAKFDAMNRILIKFRMCAPGITLLLALVFTRAQGRSLVSEKESKDAFTWTALQ